jgi:hypothetical protein
MYMAIPATTGTTIKPIMPHKRPHEGKRHDFAALPTSMLKSSIAEKVEDCAIARAKVWTEKT